MAITATGLGSGLDIESIISGLMAVERRPLNILSQRQSEIQTKISAVGKLSSALSDFKSSMNNLKSLSSFEVYSATSSNEDVFTVSANSNAAPGTYSIDLTQPGYQLAQAHKMQSAVQTNATTSTGAAGTMLISLANGSSFSISIDNTKDTLEGIRDEINNASDNAGVTATIVNGTLGSQLVLTADKTGSDYAISLSDTTGNVSTTLAMSDYQTAQNAVFSVDGIEVTSQSNTVTDAIQGITLNLKSVGTGANTLTVSKDIESVKESVQGFVDAYNTLNSTLKTLRSGDLSGDNVILAVENQLRNVFNTTPTGLNTSLAYLSEIGITTDKNGDLTLSSSKLEEQLNTDFDAIAQLLANDDQGYVFRLQSVATSLLDTDGIIDNRKDTLNTQSSSLDDRRADVEYRLTLIEKRFRKQFSSLDTLLSNLNATGSYLTQQLSTLPGAR